MKYLLALSLSFLTFYGFAEEKKEENFQSAKSRMLENIEKRLTQLQADKSCISSASGMEALKDCRKKSKEARKANRDEWKEKRGHRKDKRKEMSEED